MYKEFDALSQLLGCYFHEDWPEEFNSDMSALQAIVDSEPEEQLRAGVREIDSLLAAALSEGELRTILASKIGCCFELDSRRITCREWLQQVRDKFAQ